MLPHAGDPGHRMLAVSRPGGTMPPVREGWTDPDEPPRPPGNPTPMIRLSAFADEISADPVEQLDVLEANGIRHIEFRMIHGTNVLDLTDAQHQAFRDLLRDRGFALSAIGSPIGKIQITDPFEPHLDRFARALDLAEFYETPRIRVFSYYLPPADDPATHRDEVLRRMAETARIAADRG